MKMILAALILMLSSALSQAQNTHTVQLNWIQGSCSGLTGCVVTGNNVYSASTSGGPYTQVFSSATPITTYTLSSLPPATTYYLAVTSICASCNPTESPKSNQVQAVTSSGPPTAPVLNPPVVTELMQLNENWSGQ
jgi:hypothetical protein